MSKKYRQNNWLLNAIVFYMVFALTFGCCFNVETVHAENVQATEAVVSLEQPTELESYDLSNLKYKLYDGKDYYDYSEAGVIYNGKAFMLIPEGLPDGLLVRCIGDAQTNVGDYIVTLQFSGDDKHNPVPDMQVLLKINKANRDMSGVEFFDSNIAYDKQVHSLFATNLPTGVKVSSYEGNGVNQIGSHVITAHFIDESVDAANYNAIPPMQAVLTIVGEKDPNKLNYDETYLKFLNSSFTYDGKVHSICAFGVPENVIVNYTGNKNVKEGKYTVTAHFKGDADHNPILDRTATVTINAPESSSSSSSSESNSGNNEKPDNSQKPEQPGNPTLPEEPSNPEQPEPEQPSNPTEPEEPSNPTKPEQPENPAEQHVWSNWVYKDNVAEERTCSHCGIKETRQHDYVVSDVISTDNQDSTHTTTTTYSCTQCTATYDEVEQKDCNYGNWQYIGNDTDAMYCNDCNSSQTRPHEHEEAPADLQYVLKSSNGDGTHKLEASYTCSICATPITLSNDEACDYDITYKRTGINDTHIVVSDCKICSDHKEEEGTCISDGELKCTKVYAQIYDHYNCILCGNWCFRYYHTVHRFEPWEYRDEDTHIRYCACVEERETEEHNKIYDSDSGIVSCDKCGYEIPPHNHGMGMVNEIGLMDLLSHPARAELISNSQFANPNPNPYEYCSRYVFKCKTCGVEYYSEYAHKFKDGKCTRTGYCGGIEEPVTKMLKKVVNKVKDTTVTEVKKEDVVEEIEMEETPEVPEVKDDVYIEEPEVTETTEVESEISTEETAEESEVETETETESEGEPETEEETESETEIEAEESTEASTEVDETTEAEIEEESEEEISESKDEIESTVPEKELQEGKEQDVEEQKSSEGKNEAKTE